MQFLRASDKPVYNERGDIEYRFTEVNDGTFTVQSKEAKINLKEFSFWCCSTSESKSRFLHCMHLNLNNAISYAIKTFIYYINYYILIHLSDLDYLVKFVCPREPLLPTPHSIFAVSLATPTLDKVYIYIAGENYASCT